jgi:uncharacterized protein (DUF2252 family)
MLGKSFFVRELMPQDMTLDIRQLHPREAAELALYLGYLIGRAHVQQMEEDVWRAWRTELRRAQPKSLDAPRWLWSATLLLLADLETAYLEHCRRYLAPVPQRA